MSLIKWLEKIILFRFWTCFFILLVITFIGGYLVYRSQKKHSDIIEKLNKKGIEYIEKCSISQLKVIKRYSYQTLFFITFWELFMGYILLTAILYVIFIIINWGHFKNFTNLQRYINNQIDAIKSGTFIVLIIWCFKKPVTLFGKLILATIPASRDLLETINVLKKQEDYLDFIKLSKIKIKELKKGVQ